MEPELELEISKMGGSGNPGYMAALQLKNILPNEEIDYNEIILCMRVDIPYCIQ